MNVLRRFFTAIFPRHLASFPAICRKTSKGPAICLDVPCELANDARLKEAGVSNDRITIKKRIPDGLTVTLYAAAG